MATEVTVGIGDYIRDPMDGRLRQVASVWIISENEFEIRFVDGGVMGSGEITNDTEILLESEVTQVIA